ncbi:hypothetical protein V6C03_03125 [Methyloligella sp. 2.7D]|uniref:hypothetical protein n=1 Tax=unclassified Methyloligella TaxID=2625955 RepID=UPI00157CF0D1|nr:hypothetical protein [Methyloligella sp. GL2]QKP76385.1 hypothetical protein HT051_02300 [Methyloligella sp. GL2]
MDASAEVETAGNGQAESLGAEPSAEPTVETPQGASADTASFGFTSGAAAVEDEPAPAEQAAERAADPAPVAISVKELEDIDFTEPAALCVARAIGIARAHNHTRLDASHLVLAMTLDPDISRKLQRVLDADVARRVMTRKLAEEPWFVGTEDSSSELAMSPFLAKVLSRASDVASERDQKVSLMDILYGFDLAGEGSDMLQEDAVAVDTAPAIARRLEESLMPYMDRLLVARAAEITDQLARVLELRMPNMARNIAGEMLELMAQEMPEESEQDLPPRNSIGTRLKELLGQQPAA